MKSAALIIVVLGLVLAGDAAWEQHSGHAEAMAPSRRMRTVAASREAAPVEFEGIMAYQWIRALAVLGGGIFLLTRVLRAERTDIV